MMRTGRPRILGILAFIGLVWLAVMLGRAVSHLWPLFLVGFGLLWLVMKAPRRGPREPAPLAPAAGDWTAEVRHALASQLQTLIGHVSPDVVAKFQVIHQRILEMLPRASSLPAGSEDLYILHRTATDYLPSAFGSYLNLARARVTEQRLPDGKTPKQVLMEQLDLIDGKLAEVADALNRNDLDKLLANRRFLEERFGRSELPAGPPPASFPPAQG